MTARSLSLTNLMKHYGGLQRAVDDVSLDVAPGEFITFLGPSGSGKTTTLMMIAGFQEPSGGQINIAGRSVEHIPAYERNIGVVFQNYALFPHMTVEHNVAFPLKMRGVGKKEREPKSKDALARVGLQGFADRHPGELSGGQQQRVALARALVFEPDLILLDEPLGALDKNLREHMQLELKRIHREAGVTMIYVTHDQTEAMTMSDRIAVFNSGRIEQVGTPLDVYFKPKTKFVASFVGDSNLIDADVVGRDGSVKASDLGQFNVDLSDHRPGERVSLLIRPEMIRLRKDSHQDPNVHSCQFTIESMVNYGDNILVIGTAGQTNLRVRVPSLDGKWLREGMMCIAEWNRDNVHVVSGP
ncbi:putative spermidine/putrescine transport system ATP-binding protein [Microvirga lupini]|uniref:Putative spermidine/putrescine transport system ATP-binding protein n=1 Tax=Microvirga lupini TaxID=420324 RepID=A0A7W4VP97_9HYPH|nr:ABC transporter ATP-binding protein [Microvirga lupini]MBB3020773.1 putative spermidine/putrescine transport system ATP-binding protein [Microvirga lupini]